MGRKPDRAADGRVVRAYSAGATLGEIARSEGVSKVRILERLKRLEVWSPGPKVKGKVLVQDMGGGVGVVNGNSVRVLAALPSADLMVTSPPYDEMREYGGFASEFNFKLMAEAIVRNLAEGGVLVWVMMDQIRDGGETCSSFQHVLGFRELGLTLWHTLIWEKWSVSGYRAGDYHRTNEYMFVFCKGRKPKGGEMLLDRAQVNAGKRSPRTSGFGRHPGDVKTKWEGLSDQIIAEYGLRGSIWKYSVGGWNMGAPGEGLEYSEHPAAFPYKLARDHILSWSNPGDLVIDPMAGSGTVVLAALMEGRRGIGVEVNSEYCEIIKRRVRNANRRESLAEVPTGGLLGGGGGGCRVVCV